LVGPSGGWRRVSIERTARVGGDEAAVVTLENEPLPFGLTVRELGVLTLLSGGLNNREIAGRLATSVRTVAAHVEHILAKVAQRSRAGAVAVDRGLLRLPIPGGDDGLEGLTVGTLHELASERPRPESGVGERAVPSWVRRPLLIGSALPLTGPARGDGMEMRNGTALAIEEINARGGVGGRRLEHVVVPTDITDSVPAVRTPASPTTRWTTSRRPGPRWRTRAISGPSRTGYGVPRTAA
jgi:branched-chain amino acid transport system substrate-binding protein